MIILTPPRWRSRCFSSSHLGLSGHSLLPENPLPRCSPSCMNTQENQNLKVNKIFPSIALSYQQQIEHRLRMPAITPDIIDHNGINTRRSQDRKSTRLNSSHVAISYAVFCLKK